MDQPLWQPSEERIAATNLIAFMRHVERRWGAQTAHYDEIYQWSIAHPEQFWQSIWTFCGVIGEGPGATVLVNGDRTPGARWFPEARLNFAENLLRRRD